jgi:hypothetical protein
MDAGGPFMAHRVSLGHVRITAARGAHTPDLEQLLRHAYNVGAASRGFREVQQQLSELDGGGR